ncbi:MAG: putative maltokinase, partial [Syntrophales bacterium]|nr:putative maltokinase [Syntrophales bacterium]
VYSQDPQARINLGIRRRLAPLLGNHRRRIELMKSLLFAMPGTPVLYYGDEIGMGDNIFLGDRDGVRTPMQWSADRNAGFSRANSQRLYLPVNIDPEYHYEAINVEAQQNNPHSLLWWMKRLIALRKQHKALSRGGIEFLYPENNKILAFLRCHQEECMLVVNNLSRFVQYAELDLSAHQGLVPRELISQIPFPAIGEQPYFLTMGPHSTYWFSLEEPPPAEIQLTPREARIPTYTLSGPAEELFRRKNRQDLAALIPPYLTRCRWFGGKARNIKAATITEVLPFPYGQSVAYFTLVRVSYVEGEPETYVLPLAAAFGERAAQVEAESPQEVVAHLRGQAQEGVLFEAVGDNNFHQALLEAMARRRHFKANGGELLAKPTQVFRQIQRLMKPPLSSSIMKAEQSNTSIVFGDWLILKLMRRAEEGMNLDLEIGLFLTEKSSFAYNPPVAGSLEYRPLQGQPITLGILHGFVPNQGDAWKYTLDVLGNFFEAALATQAELGPDLLPQKPLVELTKLEVPALALDMIGPYLESARLLGERTAELHLALASNLGDPLFAPEPFSTLYQRSIYQSMRNLTARIFQLLRQRLKHLTAKGRAQARKVLDMEEEVFNRFRALIGKKIKAMRIRVHGDFHLGQVLFTGKDFIIIDFEGEPARSLTERRLKRSALRDVAGMLRSFHYAAYHAIYSQAVRPEDIPAVEKWAHFWHLWVSAVYLKTYLDLAGAADFLPQDAGELQILLSSLCLEKAIYELGYELNNRPEWVNIPLQGILQLLGVVE